jgi:phage tail-like protein
MRDVNGSSFALLASQQDWSASQGMSPWTGCGFTLAGKQNWLLPQSMTRANARAALAASAPTVIDDFGATASISADGLSIVSPGGAALARINDLAGNPIAPKTGRFVGMALGAGRLALLSSDGTNSFLQLFDLRQRFPLDTVQNPSLPLTLDPTGTAVAVAPDGIILVLVTGGLALCTGGPILTFVDPPSAHFAPVADNPNPLRLSKLVASRPAGEAIAMTADAGRVAILSDDGGAQQTIAIMDRTTGAWTSTPVVAVDGTPLPYMTDIALLDGGQIALMAPSNAAGAPADCAVVSLQASGVSLAPFRTPMLNQSAPRFAAVPGPAVYYLGLSGPRQLLPLPYPAYLTSGALGRFGLAGGDPDLVWHRLYAEASLPSGTSLAVWARAAEAPVAQPDGSAMLAIILAAPPGTSRIDTATAAAIARNSNLSPVTASLSGSLNQAPFHLQPPLALSGLASELPFHPGLAALDGQDGSLFEMLLQRTRGANRRLTGAFLDLVVVASGDGRHSPCLRALRITSPRFCYQDQYLPSLFQQTEFSDETDVSPQPSPPDFRERLLACLEGVLTPIETRVAAAEMILDPDAAPAAMLPWLGSYLGRSVDPGWPVARTRRLLANAGRQLRQRGTYRGVCLALDIATDGGVASGAVVLLETHRLRRTDATILGIPLSGLNPLTAQGVASGNSIVGDTLFLSAERAIDVLALLSPEAARGASAATVSQFLDEYADRIQVAAILQGPGAPALKPAVQAVLEAELPAQLRFDIVVAQNRFVLGLSPLLDIDTFLDPPVAPAPLTLDASTLGRDAIVRDPAALRQ